MKKSEKLDVFLGPQTAVEGNLEVQGTVRIDGYFKGNITSEGCTMIVGEEAYVEADISVDTVSVSGEVRGNINATHRIELSPTARVFGDLHTRGVIIAAGSVLEGRCTIEPQDRAAGNSVKAESTE